MLVTCIDVETTGLIKNRHAPLDKQPKVIEFCAMDVNLKTGKKAKPFDVFLNPGEKLEHVITKITGITDDDLKVKTTFKNQAAKIKKICAGSDKVKAIVAHNMTFDSDMIDIELERLKMKVKWLRKICTIEQTMHLKGYRLNQQALHQELFEKKFVGAHRASGDVHALADICIELYKRGMIK